MVNLIFYSYNNHFLPVIEYLYDKNTDKIDSFVYLGDMNKNKYTYYMNRYNSRESIKTIVPHTCKFSSEETIKIDGSDVTVPYTCELDSIQDKDNNPRTTYHSTSSCSGEDRFIQRLVITSDNREYLSALLDVAIEYAREKNETQVRSSTDTIRIFYYQKEFWNMVCKAPKRPIETLYLKEGQKETMLSMVEEFFAPDTRDLYLSFGMPYKHIVLLYGVPGSGKTTTISSIASYFNCDIYTIPITKQLTDYGLIDAFSEINDREDKKRIVVLEDIDCIFDTSRKEGDEHTMITLQSLLNCLDGHMCCEGTLLFMTANNPDKMDYAMLRSCRVDYKLELGYADEYQTKSIFETFLPKQMDKFSQFYKKISHKQFTTAMLQEFLFYNRKIDNILTVLPQFMDIIEKNNPQKLSKDTSEKNLYM